jgi:hypothetical protein
MDTISVTRIGNDVNYLNVEVQVIFETPLLYSITSVCNQQSYILALLIDKYSNHQQIIEIGLMNFVIYVIDKNVKQNRTQGGALDNM